MSHSKLLAYQLSSCSSTEVQVRFENNNQCSFAPAACQRERHMLDMLFVISFEIEIISLTSAAVQVFAGTNPYYPIG